MKSIKWFCWAFVAVIVLVGCHWLVVRFVELHSWVRLGPSEWAAWVQAVGSIAAIGAAIAMMNTQYRRQQNFAVAQDKTERANLILAAAMCCVEVKGICGAMATSEGNLDFMKLSLVTFSLERLRSVLDGADDIPIWKMGMLDARNLALVKSSCRNVIAVLHSANEGSIRRSQAAEKSSALALVRFDPSIQAKTILPVVENSVDAIAIALAALRAEYKALVGEVLPV